MVPRSYVFDDEDVFRSCCVVRVDCEYHYLTHGLPDSQHPATSNIHNYIPQFLMELICPPHRQLLIVFVEFEHARKDCTKVPSISSIEGMKMDVRLESFTLDSLVFYDVNVFAALCNEIRGGKAKGEKRERAMQCIIPVP